MTLITVLSAMLLAQAAAAGIGYAEPLRPQFHFTAAENWINDPNGLVCYGGIYHLFFQYNPTGRESANKSWGHATSQDLVHWRQHDTVLVPDELGEIWSGSAVVDVNNTSGFGRGKEKPIVLIYTAAGGITKESAGKPFTQCLAFSSDGGKTWEKYKQNPVLAHVRGQNRDPKVFWHAPTQRWVMVLYLEANDFGLFTSPDLKGWTQLQTFTVPGTDECPDFFELPIEGEAGKSAWVFMAANGKYLVGQFDGPEFKPDNNEFQAVPSDYCREFYAGQTFNNMSDGRRVQIAWLRDGKYPGMPFNQQLSFPTTLTLHRAPNGLRLHRLPVKEIELLRDKTARSTDATIDGSGMKLNELSGDLLDINAIIEIGQAKRITWRIRGQSITFDAVANTLSCLNATAPLKPIEGRITLRMLIDRTSIEVFANDGEVSLSGCYFSAEEAVTEPPTIIAEGGAARMVSCEGYTLRSAWNRR
jgi:sucrose-6-phosphate hydrolase SacC (GH32 family)